jgi:hypothetical protein
MAMQTNSLTQYDSVSNDPQYTSGRPDGAWVTIPASKRAIYQARETLMADQSGRLSDITPQGGRPLDNGALYVKFSASIDGQELFFDTTSDTTTDDYDLTVSKIGQQGFNDPRRAQFAEEQLKLIKEGISEYFRTHGRLPESRPPRKVISKTD